MFNKFLADLWASAKKGWAQSIVGLIGGAVLVLQNYGFNIDPEVSNWVIAAVLAFLGLSVVPSDTTPTE